MAAHPATERDPELSDGVGAWRRLAGRAPSPRAREHFVESWREAAQHLIDLVEADVERGHEAQEVGLRRVDEQLARERRLDQCRSAFGRELERIQQATAAHLAAVAF